MSHCAASNRGSGSERTACNRSTTVSSSSMALRRSLAVRPLSPAGNPSFLVRRCRRVPCPVRNSPASPRHCSSESTDAAGKPLQARACQDVAGLAIAGEVPGGKLRQFDRFGLEACGEDGCQLSERGFDDFPKRILELVAQTFNLGVPHDVAQPLVAAGQHRREELFAGPEVVVQMRQEF